MVELKVLRKKEEIQALRENLKTKDFCAFDTETTGLTKESLIVGFSVCSDLNEAYYVVLAEWNSLSQTLDHLDNLECAKSLIQDLKDKHIIGHNILFDVAMVKHNFNIDLLPSVHTDTMMLAHLLDENRALGLKDLAVSIFGEDSRKEQTEVKEAVLSNGGVLTKAQYELYKAPAQILGKYGAKDAELTLRLFYTLLPDLYEQKLDKFFYDEETMPLLKSATWELNFTGLKVDQTALRQLKAELEAEILQAREFIIHEISPHVKDKYPGTSKHATFNIDSNQQLAWLLFIKLNNMFGSLTKGGKQLCRELNIKVPYSNAAKIEWLQVVTNMKGDTYKASELNKDTHKMQLAKKIRDPWVYMECGKELLSTFALKYRWVAKLLEYKKNEKLLKTYVQGIQEKLRYGVIYPQFLQHGTTSGRYSSKSPNFQNLPRTDKRIKSCVVAREGKIFVGADQSQLEPRCFASVSQDPTLMSCFEKKEDFYSVVGAPMFDKYDCTMFKEDENGFAKLYPALRDIAKQFALASPYGTTGFQQSLKLKMPPEKCDEIIRKYFDSYPNVEQMMLDSHEQVKNEGVVYSLFGRPRRMPEGKTIRSIYGNSSHADLPYKIRNILNLSMNHRVQSTAASIMNRVSIALCKQIRNNPDPAWREVHLVLQVHDSLVLEGPEYLKDEMAILLKNCMENTVQLPGVKLEAEPKIGFNLSEV